MKYYYKTPFGILYISTAPYGGYNLNLEEDTINWANTPDELADVLEVIHALCKYHDFCIDDIEQLRIDKRKSRGGFEDKIILDKVHYTNGVEGILLERLI